VRILLTGKDGQVGWELQRSLQTLGEVAAFDRKNLDLADPGSVRERVRDVKPQVIVNAGAYTAVDKAESEPELARRVNALAPGILAEEAKRLGALLIHYSTDYVFDGEKSGAYEESDPTKPLGVYGKSKLEGEQAIDAAAGLHLVFRTSWVYAARGKNFLLTILKLAGEREELRVVDDQFGAPTWCRTIAEATSQIVAKLSGSEGIDSDLARRVRGIYHLSAGGRVSWCGFARAIVAATRRQPGRTPKVTPIPSAEYPLPPRRPANSILSNAKLQRTFDLTCPDWDDALALCIADLGA
jgi:dTDP-4-dehydrorhamnose reductase